jgi:hypothetical protein
LFRLCKVEFLTLLCNDNHVTNRMLSSLKWYSSAPAFTLRKL